MADLYLAFGLAAVKEISFSRPCQTQIDSRRVSTTQNISYGQSPVTPLYGNWLTGTIVCEIATRRHLDAEIAAHGDRLRHDMSVAARQLSRSSRR
jgi:hypothetical protein